MSLKDGRGRSRPVHEWAASCSDVGCAVQGVLDQACTPFHPPFTIAEHGGAYVLWWRGSSLFQLADSHVLVGQSTRCVVRVGRVFKQLDLVLSRAYRGEVPQERGTVCRNWYADRGVHEQTRSFYLDAAIMMLRTARPGRSECGFRRSGLNAPSR